MKNKTALRVISVWLTVIMLITTFPIGAIAETDTDTEPGDSPEQASTPEYGSVSEAGELAFVSNGDGTCVVAGIGSCADTDIMIPKESPAGDIVTSIGDYAFYNCDNLTSITIPDSVTSIGEGTFEGCNILTIKCQAVSKPAGWSDNWNPGNCPVIWGGNQFGSKGLEYSGSKVVGRGTCTDSVIIIPPVTPDGVPVTGILGNSFNDVDLVSIPYVFFTDEYFDLHGGVSKIYYDISQGIQVEPEDVYYGFEDLYWIDSYGVTHEHIFSQSPTRDVACYPCYSDEYGLVYKLDESKYFDNELHAYCFREDADVNPASILWRVPSAKAGTVFIPDSVTELCTNAFENCSEVTGIVVDKNNTHYYSSGNCLIETLTDKLVAGCRNSIIPTDGSVTVIGDYAFYGNTSLTAIVIPDGITSIGSYAFAGCTGLTEIIIPESVVSIGEHAFDGVPNVRYAGAADGSPWGAFAVNGYVNDGIVFADNTESVLLKYLADKIGDIVIPDSVTVIADNAFANCTDLTTVAIPDSVTSIGKNAFSGCTGLTDVSLGNGVKTIGEYAFAGCSKLTNITIPVFVSSIDDYAFFGDDLLTIHCLGDFKHDDKWNCTGCTRYQYSYGDSKWYETYYYCDVIMNFSTGLEYVSNGDGTCYVSGLGTCTDSEIIIPRTFGGEIVTGIGSGAFKYDYQYQDNDNITSVIIPDTVISIGDSAFSSQERLESITIPDSVTSIGWYAFEYCFSLKNVTIPESVVSIGNCAFSDCLSLTSIVIPESVKYVGWDIFWNCNTITVMCRATCKPSGWSEGWNEYWAEYDGEQIEYYCPVVWGYGYSSGLEYVSNGDGTCVVAGIGTCTVAELIIPQYSPAGDLVTGIAEAAFSGCTNLVSITIPDSVTYIGEYAFCNHGICTVYNGALYVGTADNPFYAMVGCEEGVTSLTIHQDTVLIGSLAGCCSTLQRVTLPDGIAYINDNAFEGSDLRRVIYHGDWNDIEVDGCNDALENAYNHLTATSTISGTLLLPLTMDGAATLTVTDAVTGELLDTMTVTGSRAVSYSVPYMTGGSYVLTLSGAHCTTYSYTVSVGDTDAALDIELRLTGDINGDGKVSTVDVAMANAHVRRVLTLDGYALYCADVFGSDGQLTTGDVARLNAFVRGTAALD